MSMQLASRRRLLRGLLLTRVVGGYYLSIVYYFAVAFWFSLSATTFSYSASTACSIISRVSALTGKAISQYVPSLSFLVGNERKSPVEPWMTLMSWTRKQWSKQMLA